VVCTEVFEVVKLWRYGMGLVVRPRRKRGKVGRRTDEGRGRGGPGKTRIAYRVRKC